MRESFSVSSNGETTPRIHNRKPDSISSLNVSSVAAGLPFGDDNYEGGGGNAKIAGSKETNNGSTARRSTIAGPLRSSMRQQRRRQRTLPTANSGRASSDMYGFFKIVLYILVSGCIVVIIQRSVFTRSNTQADSAYENASEDITKEQRLSVSEQLLPTTDKDKDRQLETQPKRPLDEFPTLQEVLDTSDIVALYFAAAWCPMSTPITNLLDHTFRHRLVHDNENHNPRLAVLYISSDRDVASYTNYIQPGWKSVPYENVEERSALKRYFRTCAKPEMDDVGLATRDYEIPNIIVINSSTRQVLTYTGIQDLKELGYNALDAWVEFQKVHAVLGL